MRKFLTLLKFSVQILLVSVVASCFGQSKDDSIKSTSNKKTEYKRSYFVDFNYGFGGNKNAFQLQGAIQVSNKVILSLGSMGTFAYINMLTAQPNSHEVYTKMLAIGMIHKYKNSMLMWEIGPTLNKVYIHDSSTGFLFGNPPKIKNDVPGILIEGKGILAGRFAGLSLSSFVNINSEFTYGGVTFGFVIGRLIVSKARS